MTQGRADTGTIELPPVMGPLPPTDDTADTPNLPDERPLPVTAHDEHRPRTIVVTGATGDAGRAVCARFAAEATCVVALGSDAGRLHAVDADVHHVVDLTDAAATRALAARVRDAVGEVDGVVHLVGGWRGGHDDADWAWLEPRLVGTLRHVTLAFGEQLAASPAGRLAVVGATGAAHPTWANANYTTLKAASSAWVQAVASGWKKGGTAAAVEFVVTALGDDHTPVSTLADAVVALWHRPAAELNGARIRL